MNAEILSDQVWRLNKDNFAYEIKYINIYHLAETGVPSCIRLNIFNLDRNILDFFFLPHIPSNTVTNENEHKHTTKMKLHLKDCLRTEDWSIRCYGWLMVEIHYFSTKCKSFFLILLLQKFMTWWKQNKNRLTWSQRLQPICQTNGCKRYNLICAPRPNFCLESTKEEKLSLFTFYQIRCSINYYY